MSESDSQGHEGGIEGSRGELSNSPTPSSASTSSSSSRSLTSHSSLPSQSPSPPSPPPSISSSPSSPSTVPSSPSFHPRISPSSPSHSPSPSPSRTTSSPSSPSSTSPSSPVPHPNIPYPPSSPHTASPPFLPLTTSPTSPIPSPPQNTNTSPPSPHLLSPKPYTCRSSSFYSSLASLTFEPMMYAPLAEAVMGQLQEIAWRLPLSLQETQSLEERVRLTVESVQEALVFVATRRRYVEELKEDVEMKEAMLEMREVVVEAEVERHRQRLEDLSVGLVDKMNSLQDLHDALTPALARRFKDTVVALKDAAEGEEEAGYFSALLDRREGTQTPSRSIWPEPHPVRGEKSRGLHFRFGREEVFLQAQSGEVWVRVRLPDLDPKPKDSRKPSDMPLGNSDVTTPSRTDPCDLKKIGDPVHVDNSIMTPISSDLRDLQEPSDLSLENNDATTPIITDPCDPKEPSDPVDVNNDVMTPISSDLRDLKEPNDLSPVNYDVTPAIQGDPIDLKEFSDLSSVNDDVTPSILGDPNDPKESSDLSLINHDVTHSIQGDPIDLKDFSDLSPIHRNAKPSIQGDVHDL